MLFEEGEPSLSGFDGGEDAPFQIRGLEFLSCFLREGSCGVVGDTKTEFKLSPFSFRDEGDHKSPSGPKKGAAGLEELAFG